MLGIKIAVTGLVAAAGAMVLIVAIGRPVPRALIAAPILATFFGGLLVFFGGLLWSLWAEA
jgi:hypothetical protein